MENKKEICGYLISISTDIESLAKRARKNSLQIEDPKSQALFKITEEVLIGLKHAFDDCLQQDELVWK